MTSAFKRQWINALWIAQLVLHQGRTATVPPVLGGETKAAIAKRCQAALWIAARMLTGSASALFSRMRRSTTSERA